MERHSIRSLTSTLFIVTVLTGCAPLTQYRTKYEVCVNPTPTFSQTCETHALQQLPAADGTSYLLGFIEFDDQGQVLDRKQMWSVIDKLTAEAANKDFLLVVFVHGWKHSAAPNDSNIETFRKVLAGLSEDENNISRQKGLPARQVAGIYLGWRGGSVTAPIAKELTFWDRKNTAQTVGHGGVTEVLSRIELIKRDKDSTMQGKSGTRLVIVGHSFGGAVVHAALAQILESRFLRTTGPAGTQSNVDGFGNLTVLINPAFEALLFSPLSDMSSERGYYSESQLPVMAVLTSEADYATRYAFKAGRIFSTLIENERDIKRRNAATNHEEIIDEGKANITAVGHFEPYRTHELYPSNEVARDKTTEFSSSETIRSVLQFSSAWENDKPGSKISLAGLTLERTNTSTGRNPYLVIRVNKELITDHNDIDDPRIVNFIKQLILISTHSAERRAISYQIEVLENEVRRTLARGERPTIELLGTNATGALHQGREVLIQALAAGGTVRLLVLDPESQAFRSRADREGDRAGRIAAELLASFHILMDITGNTDPAGGGNLEVRLYDTPPDRSLIIVNRGAQNGVVLSNPYPDLERARGLTGKMYKWIPEDQFYRDDCEHFDRLWNAAEMVELHQGETFRWPFRRPGRAQHSGVGGLEGERSGK